MTIYDKEGLRCDVEDGEAVSIYLEGERCVTMTLSEWREINFMIEEKVQ